MRAKLKERHTFLLPLREKVTREARRMRGPSCSIASLPPPPFIDSCPPRA